MRFRLGHAPLALALLLARAAPAAAVREDVAVAFGMGWSSAVADPEVAEGYGGSLAAWIRLAGRFGARLTLDVAINDLEGRLADIPWPYATADLTFGPLLELTDPESPVAVRLSFETGPYWAGYLPGLAASWGLNFGTAFLWHFTDPVGIQAELRYHLYNLASLGDEVMRCPLTLQELGTLDRLDLFFSLVVVL